MVITYLSTWKNIVWSTSLVALQIFEIDEVCFDEAVLDGVGQKVFLNTGMWHGTVIVRSIGSGCVGTSCRRLINTSVGTNARIRDVESVIELRRVECLEGSQALGRMRSGRSQGDD